jgi:carboxyl-terminal processing protease
MNHSPIRSLLGRLTLAPAIIGLVSTSVIFGYASTALRQSHHESSEAQYMLTSRVDADDSGATDTPEPDIRSRGLAQDPLDNYRSTLALLKRNYYGGPIDSRRTRTLTYEAIRGMLGSLRDQFTSFLDPDDWSQMKETTEGDFEGIGALLEQEGAQVRIVRPIETSPAETAGIKADDVIVSVDGVSVKGLGVNDVVRRIKGQEGTRVRLGILRGRATLEFSLTRALIEPPVVQHWMEDSDGKIGHIVLSEFNEKSIAQIRKAYSDLNNQGMRALVFDLRYNPGGLLETAEDVASLFIPKDQDSDLHNVVVFIHEGSGKEKGDRLRTPEFSVKRMPMVVLVNGNSASASEIVSGALKDYGMATLIGERTYGKGRVQTLYPLDDGSALRLTTALYYPPRHYDINFERDPDGQKIEGTGGILPDIEVKQSPKWHAEDFKDKANDAQLDAALNFLRSRLNGKTVAEAREQLQVVH